MKRILLLIAMLCVICSLCGCIYTAKAYSNSNLVIVNDSNAEIQEIVIHTDYSSDHQRNADNSPLVVGQDYGFEVAATNAPISFTVELIGMDAQTLCDASFTATFPRDTRNPVMLYIRDGADGLPVIAE